MRSPRRFRNERGGTTGFGWGVHQKQEWAEDAAMEKCRESSSQKRRAFCRVTFTKCDGR